MCGGGGGGGRAGKRGREEPLSSLCMDRIVQLGSRSPYYVNTPPRPSTLSPRPAKTRVLCQAIWHNHHWSKVNLSSFWTETAHLSTYEKHILGRFISSYGCHALSKFEARFSMSYADHASVQVSTETQPLRQTARSCLSEFAVTFPLHRRKVLQPFLKTAFTLALRSKVRSTLYS